MNKKGFTLVELLAVLVILSIIMLIAVPSTLNVLDRNKKDSYISDAKKLITLAETKLRSDMSIEYPTGNQIVVIGLSSLNNGDIDTTADGDKYNNNNSYVAISYFGSETQYNYKFAVQLFGSKRGVTLSKSEDLIGDARYTKVDTNNIVSKTCQEIGERLGISSPSCLFY